MFEAFDRWPNATVAVICIVLFSAAVAFSIASVPDQRVVHATVGQKSPLTSSLPADLLR